jgi:hypothetical protein
MTSQPSRRGFLGSCAASVLGVGIAATTSIVKGAGPVAPAVPVLSHPEVPPVGFPSWNNSPLSPSSVEYAQVQEWLQQAVKTIQFIPPEPPPPPKPSSQVCDNSVMTFNTNPDTCTLVFSAERGFEIDVDSTVTMGSPRTGQIVFTPGKGLEYEG